MRRVLCIATSSILEHYTPPLEAFPNYQVIMIDHHIHYHARHQRNGTSSSDMEFWLFLPLCRFSAICISWTSFDLCQHPFFVRMSGAWQ